MQKSTIDLINQITDWYIPVKNPMEGYIYLGKENQDIKKSGTEIKIMAQRLEDLCNENLHKGEDFKISYKESKEDKYEFRYRVHFIKGAENDMFALRYIPREIIPAENLKLPLLVNSVLKSKALSRGGLIIVSGETGQGKTTTCSSMIQYRLKEFGNFALTIEDPPEYFMDGKYGDKNGRCIQTEVFSGGFAAALKGAMRSYPAQSGSILYVGETRDSETASEIIKAVTNGHIVFTTIHGMDILSTITRFVAMCSGQNLSEDEVRQTIAMSLRLVVHQRLERFTPKDGAQTVHVHCESLFSDGPTSSVANKIISSNIRGLAGDIREQEAKIRSVGPSAIIGDWEKTVR